MAAVWAFCVGVQAEDMGRSTFPRQASDKDHPLHPATVGHLPPCSRGEFTCSRGKRALEGKSLGFQNTSGMGTNVRRSPSTHTNPGAGCSR